jgi:hypothetical protein
LVLLKAVMKSKELAVPLGVLSVLMILFPKLDPVFEIPFFTPWTASENRIIPNNLKYR